MSSNLKQIERLQTFERKFQNLTKRLHEYIAVCRESQKPVSPLLVAETLALTLENVDLWEESVSAGLKADEFYRLFHTCCDCENLTPCEAKQTEIIEQVIATLKTKLTSDEIDSIMQLIENMRDIDREIKLT